MAEIWDENENLDAEEELVATDQRDRDETLDPEDEPEQETTITDPEHVLDEYGEDVSSSPAQRGQATGQEA